MAPKTIWDRLPRNVQEHIVARDLKLHVIDAYGLAQNFNLGMRVNTIMQAAFFRLCPVIAGPRKPCASCAKALPTATANAAKRIVDANLAAIDAGWEGAREVIVPGASRTVTRSDSTLDECPSFVQTVTFPLLRGEGDALPVSAFPPDGTYPAGTARWEKRSIAMELPVWEADLCIQCGKCVLVCPHAVIRAKVCDESEFARRPGRFRPRSGEMAGPARAPASPSRWPRTIAPAAPYAWKFVRRGTRASPAAKRSTCEPKNEGHRAQRAHWSFFEEQLPQRIRSREATVLHTVKDIQLLDPLFEFSGACAGCGETPYLKLLTQLFGDRMMVANATGCSSIYGGNLPTTPWTHQSRGPRPVLEQFLVRG